MSTGLMPVWAGRTMRLDPFRLPQAVSYAAHDEHGEVTFTINHRGVTVRRMLERSGLPAAIALPAKVFRIPERGRVAKGLIADLVAFDPQTIDHECDYRDPVRPPSGIAWVMQEGAMVVDGRTYTGPRRGRRLTPAA